jgi:hypothetical protein
MAISPVNPEDVHESVRSYDAKSALAVMSGAAACCGPAGAEDAHAETGAGFYKTVERDELPETAVLASLGCGNPTQWPSSGRARRCSTSAQAVASMSSCRPSG